VLIGFPVAASGAMFNAAATFMQSNWSGSDMKTTAHESLERQNEPNLGSNRSFGFVMAAAGVVLGLLALWSNSLRWAAFWVAAASCFAVVAFVSPDRLELLNRAWFRFGLLLHRVISPVMMAVMFFGVVTPLGLLMRFCRQQPLALDFDRDAQTYWTTRSNGTFAPGSMRKQY